MAQIVSGIRRILNVPFIYNLLGHIIGVKKTRQIYIADYIKPTKNIKILDLGCGPATILEHLSSEIEYYGIDLNPFYIEFAKRKFGNKGTFISEDINNLQTSFPKFDVVLATGVLHHLDDHECLKLFEIAQNNLHPGGRLITLDCCYYKSQSKIARFIINQDRGQNIRTVEEYQILVKYKFNTIKTSIRQDLLRIPYTHIIMECSNSS